MALRTPLSVTPHLYMGDSTGRPLDKGVVYFGEQDKDPEFYPINLFSDDALTKPLAQPVHTKGGYLYDKGDMVEPHAKELIYSVKVLDSYGRKVFYKGAMMRNSWNDDVIQQINAALVSTAEEAAQIATDVAKEIANKAVMSIGFVTVDSFELGATITQRNQALRHAADGKLYRWAGDLPKVVPVSSTPASTGGFSSNAWLEVSDATLRTQLASPFGANLVGRTVITLDSVKDMRSEVMTAENRNTDATYLLRSFHSGRNLGGGLFYWDAIRSKTEHNGGTVIDPDKNVFSVSEPNQSEIDSWFTASLTGSGVFVKMPNSYVSPTEFGSVGEIHIVDQAAFEAATKSSSSLFVEPLEDGGSYLLDLFNPQSNSEIWGVGAASKIKLAAGYKGNTSVEYGGALLIRGREFVTLRSFLVDGNKENVTATSLVNVECINFKECTNCHSVDLITINSASDGIDLDDCTDCTSTRIQAFDCNGYGIHISVGSVRCHTYNSIATRCGISGERGGFDVHWSASYSSVNDCISIECYIGAMITGETNSVTNHKSYNDIRNGVRLVDGATCTNAIIRDTVGGIDEQDAGVRLGNNTRFINGEIFDCVTHGVYIPGNGATISNSLVKRNTGTGILLELVAPPGYATIDGVNVEYNTGGDFLNNSKTVIYGGNNQIRTPSPYRSVGSIALLATISGASVKFGAIIDASRLRYSNTSGATLDVVNFPEGTWRCLSFAGGVGSPESDRVGLYVRVS